MKWLKDIMNNVIDKATNELDGVVQGKVDEFLEEGKLKRILRKSIMDYKEFLEIGNLQNETDSIINEEILREQLQLLDKNKINPNLTVEELEKNLSALFEACIITEDKERVDRIKKYICCSYKFSVAEFITINQVDEDVHKVHETVKQGHKEIVAKIDKTTMKIDGVGENVYKIKERLKQLPQQQIVFMDELDNSRKYLYISIKITEEIDYEWLEEIADELYAEWRIDIDEYGIVEILFEFLEPMVQSELREKLKYIDGEFCWNGIGILGITSHF